MWLLLRALVRFLAASRRRREVQQQLKDTLIVERAIAEELRGQDYWLQRDLRQLEEKRRRGERPQDGQSPCTNG